LRESYTKHKEKFLILRFFYLHRHIYSLNRNLRILSSNLSNLLPSYIWNEILNTYSNSFRKYRYRLSLKHCNKFFWLRHKTNKNVAKKISPINFCYTPEDKDNNIIYTHSEIIKFSDRPKININIDTPTIFVITP